MWYKYETHAHTSECSKCGKSTVREMVRKYAESGYSGMFFTDHFIFGNTAVPTDLSYNRFLDRYQRTYEDGIDEGNKQGISVFPGVEYYYNDGCEALLLGIDIDFLRINTDLAWIPLAEVCDRVRAYGGMTVRVHPFRHFSFTPQKVIVEYDHLDGVEVYNFFNTELENRLARQDAEGHDILRFSGTDSHMAHPDHAAKGGIALTAPVNSGKEFVRAVRMNNYSLIIGGSVAEG